MSKHTPTEEIARQKYQNALALIERAQLLLADACGELSPLEGAYKEWQKVGKEYDRVHQLWRNVAYSIARDNVDLDPGAKSALSKSAHNNLDECGIPHMLPTKGDTP